MPGPKMGPRPADFDETVIRQSPTFQKWLKLKKGDKLKYACREFVRGHGDDEERLMRRIMIARRNNIRDHETLKEARKHNNYKSNKNNSGSSISSSNSSRNRLVNSENNCSTTRMASPAPTEAIVTIAEDQQLLETGVENSSTNIEATCNVVAQQQLVDLTDSNGDHDGSISSNRRQQHANTVFSDDQVQKEMDVPAIEATRSYRRWMTLTDGQEFVYNQKYVKGRDGHDWLLRKNIWRRMRYRRENKRLVERLKSSPSSTTTTLPTRTQDEADMAHYVEGVGVGSDIVDDGMGTATLEEERDHQHHHSDGTPNFELEAAAAFNAAVSAAVGAAAAAETTDTETMTAEIADAAMEYDTSAFDETNSIRPLKEDTSATGAHHHHSAQHRHHGMIIKTEEHDTDVVGVHEDDVDMGDDDDEDARIIRAMSSTVASQLMEADQAAVEAAVAAAESFGKHAAAVSVTDTNQHEIDQDNRHVDPSSERSTTDHHCHSRLAAGDATSLNQDDAVVMAVQDGSATAAAVAAAAAANLDVATVNMVVQNPLLETAAAQAALDAAARLAAATTVHSHGSGNSDEEEETDVVAASTTTANVASFETAAEVLLGDNVERV